MKNSNWYLIRTLQASLYDPTLDASQLAKHHSRSQEVSSSMPTGGTDQFYHSVVKTIKMKSTSNCVSGATNDVYTIVAVHILHH